MLRAAVSGAHDVARIVGDERVRHHEMALAVNLGPVGQVVAVAIGVVEETAFLGDELARVDAHLAAIPAQRPRPRRLLERDDGALDRLALLVPVHLVVVAPAVAVPHNVVAALGDLRPDCRIALDRHGRAEDRDRNAGRVEDAEHPPDPGARAVLVHGLDRKVPLVLDRKRELVHAVVDLIAHCEGLLGAFLVVNHDVHGHLGVVLPAHARQMLAIADQLARQTRHALEVVLAEELGVVGSVWGGEWHRGRLLVSASELQSSPARFRPPSTTRHSPFT